tara:strand:- start:10740 stop:10916 length:177 start_codon:yes stop_codon:yes gene_type:complete
MKPGIIPLGTLAIVFAIIQIWWIGMTVRNGRAAEKAIKERKLSKLESQKQKLEKLIKN